MIDDEYDDDNLALIYDTSQENCKQPIKISQVKVITDTHTQTYRKEKEYSCTGSQHTGLIQREIH